jgi:hypothetical protein
MWKRREKVSTFKSHQLRKIRIDNDYLKPYKKTKNTTQVKQ